MADRGGEFSLFQGIHVRIDVKIDISITIRPMITKFDTNEIDQSGAGDVITSDQVKN